MNTKERYEISIWEDFLVDAVIDEDGSIKTPPYYDEKKLAIIGSNTMTSQCRAIEPKLVENINGTNTLTFKMYYTYVDNETGERYSNPFINLLVNERKIKAFWKNKWYDLIIKVIQEDSNGKSITYTCKDLYVNELSKNGFNLEFNNDLENNQGTIEELGEKILEDTDWLIDDENSDVIQQTREEPVYIGKTLGDVEAQQINGSKSTIAAGTTVYLFYSTIQSFIEEFEKEKFEGKVRQLQFAIAPEKSDKNEMLADKARNFIIEDVNWSYDKNSKQLIFNSLIEVAPYARVSNEFRIERYVDSQEQVFESALGRLVYKYEKDGKELYGYSATEYKDPTVVGNLIVNPKEFKDFSGWDALKNSEPFTFTLFPEANSTETIAQAESYLRLGKGLYFNDISQNGTFLPDGFSIGDKFIFRHISYQGNDTTPIDIRYEKGLEPLIRNYTIDEDGNKVMADSDGYFTYNADNINNVEDENGIVWREIEMTCVKSLSKKESYTQRWGLFINRPDNDYLWIKEIQFFPLVIGEKIQTNLEGEKEIIKSRINPGEMDKLSTVSVKYKYYYPNKDYKNSEDIQYEYSGITPWENIDNSVKPVFVKDYEKIRSIEAKNSNRFNLLQTLAETFECYLKFSIEHYEDGRIVPGSKKVSFKKQIGQRTGIGFIYGIDLKTISRTIKSEQIATKVIVTPNNNEFGEDGFCTIARSSENYSKENFILNFDYYINQGLINGGKLNEDLYSNTGDIDGSIGYYYNLSRINSEYDEITKLLSQRNIELLKQESVLKVYDEQISSINSQLNEMEYELSQLTNISVFDKMEIQNYLLKCKNQDTKVKSLFDTYLINEKSLKTFSELRNKLNTSIEYITLSIADIETRQEELLKKANEFHKKFYIKYSRFIQEGTWTSEQYIDDNLYYLDAQSIAYTSSRPQIAYNISVIRLSALEEYKNKKFYLGDISFIQDTEFFGYTWINQIKTPYKEEVLISEIISNFDSPEKDSFKVQNYKTQFEDLFQRITATTQALQYASGQYQKAANAFTSTGEIKVETLQNSIAINNQLVYSSINDTVLQDSTGLTVIDTANPNKKTKVTSGGIFITTDGGATWKNAVRGDGLSTQYLTSGNINTGSIVILDGDFTSFRWDKAGINAYEPILNDNGDTVGMLLSRFVRFDHYGLYGINNDFDGIYNPNEIDETTGLRGEEKIWNDANFGLTWKGFFLKNDDGSVQINSIDDIVVKDENGINRVKIGRIEKNAEKITYGIRISNANGAPVMESNDDGTLWLKERLNIDTYSPNNSVAIGKLDTEETKDSEHGGRVINANDKFVVYEDGHMKATGGEFEGTIIATGGKIGNLTIGELESGIAKNKSLKILSKKGETFKINSSGVNPFELLFEAQLNGFEQIDINDIKWSGSNDFDNWSILTSGSIFVINYDTFKNNNLNSIYYIKVEYIQTDKTYTDYVTLNQVSDGIDGEDPITLVIVSSNGGFFRNNQGSTTLTAKLFKGGQEIDKYEPYDYLYSWYDISNPDLILHTTKSILVTAEDVSFSRTYGCDIAEKEE